MKLKYYLRGIGIGVILTAIIMGFALGGRKATISDAQVIERAKELGMTEGGVLTAGSGEVENDGASLASSSGEALDEAGKEVSKEVDETVALASESISTLVKEEEKTEDKKSEVKADTGRTSSEAATLVSKNNDSSASNTSSKDNADTSATAESTAKNETTKTTEETASNEATVETKAQDGTASANASSEANTQVAASSVNTESKTVTIPGGLSSDGVALVLYNAGVIDNASSFNRYLIDQGKDRIIRSGTKVIPAGATYAEIAAIITK